MSSSCCNNTWSVWRWWSRSCCTVCAVTATVLVAVASSNSPPLSRRRLSWFSGCGVISLHRGGGGQISCLCGRAWLLCRLWPVWVCVVRLVLLGKGGYVKVQGTFQNVVCHLFQYRFILGGVPIVTLYLLWLELLLQLKEFVILSLSLSFLLFPFSVGGHELFSSFHFVL